MNIHIDRSTYATMLRAGLCEDAVFQRMTMVDRLSPEVAAVVVNDLVTSLDLPHASHLSMSAVRAPAPKPLPTFPATQGSVSRGRYYHMLKAGLAKAAVVQRMRIDGLTRDEALEMVDVIAKQVDDAKQNVPAPAPPSATNATSHVIIPNRVAVVNNAIPRETCQKLIKMAEGKAFTRNDDIQSLDQRWRYQWYDDSAATQIFEAVRRVLPERISRGRTLDHVGDKLRMYKYEVGECFTPHVDGGSRVYGGKKSGCTSVYTYVVYLNDEEDGLEGGGTRFCDVPKWPSNEDCTIQPRAGSVLTFQQRGTKHEGCEVLQGTKYILQGHVMYTPPRGTDADGKPIRTIAPIFDLVQCDCDSDARSVKRNVFRTKINNPFFHHAREQPFAERIALMLRVDVPEEFCRIKLRLEGLSEQSCNTIMAEARQISVDVDRQKKDDKQGGESLKEEDAKKSSGASITDTPYYNMLKRRVPPMSAYNYLIYLGKLPEASARRQIHEAIRVLKEKEGIEVEWSL